MRRGVLAIAVVVGALVPFLISADPAHACSCASAPGRPPVEFVGVAKELVSTEGTPRWRFDVVSGRGVAVGAPVDVYLDVEYETTTPDGLIGRVSSSCGLGASPVVGLRYRVGAYAGEVDGERRLFANQCGGSFAAAQAAPATEAREPSPALFGAVALALVAVVAVTVQARRPLAD